MPKKTKELTIRSSAAEYLTYIAATGDNTQSFEMRYEDENILLMQKMMAVLYDVDKRTVGYHIKKIYEDNELQEEATVRKYWTVQIEGERQVEKEREIQWIIVLSKENFRKTSLKPQLLSCFRSKITPMSTATTSIAD
jgi:hypothetical protein